MGVLRFPRPRPLRSDRLVARLPEEPRGGRRLLSPARTGGLLGASAASWIATSPSLLPRTWWMWMANVGLSQVYGWAVGAFAEALAARILGGLGLRMRLADRAASWLRAGSTAGLLGISAYSWTRGALRQREISQLMGRAPRPLVTHAVGAAAGTGLFAVALLCARGIRGTLTVYRALLRGRLPQPLAAVTAAVLTTATVGVLAERIVRGELLERGIARAEAANLLIAPDLAPPLSPLRSGSPASLEPWASLGAPGRRIVAGGASREVIAATIDRDAQEPIRVYAGKGGARPLEESVVAVIDELERTGAFERDVLVLFTGTGTGWLQEWSLSAVEFLSAGDCATASLQYSVLTSGLNYVVDRHAPQRAGRMLFRAVRDHLAGREGHRPRLFVSGESLGSYGGHAAFADAADMLASVDGAVWTGTPGFTRIWRELTAQRDAGSSEVAPVIDGGRHIRFVTRPGELWRSHPWPGGPGRELGAWEAPRVVYVQHASDPVVWWQPRLLVRRPDWTREQAGADVSPAVRWWPWVTFWQVAADMPLSHTMPAGHGHSYHEELVAVWAAVLGVTAGEAELHRIAGAIRSVAERGGAGDAPGVA